MLGAMHEMPVSAGDAIFVPAGTPHAIGEGILLVELQEPTDLSVLLEWDGFELSEDDGHLNLGWDSALEALDRTAWNGERLAGLQVRDARLFPEAADPYFRAERLADECALDREALGAKVRIGRLWQQPRGGAQPGESGAIPGGVQGRERAVPARGPDARRPR